MRQILDRYVDRGLSGNLELTKAQLLAYRSLVGSFQPCLAPQQAPWIVAGVESIAV